ncbi:MAG: hypothetical protein GPOALKHO_002000 [Sodalis sp.]|nr:MAG: hypothetical protein GPOALKHO_002000 [Sodalis sp.]
MIEIHVSIAKPAPRCARHHRPADGAFNDLRLKDIEKSALRLPKNQPSDSPCKR